MINKITKSQKTNPRLPFFRACIFLTHNNKSIPPFITCRPSVVILNYLITLTVFQLYCPPTAVWTVNNGSLTLAPPQKSISIDIYIYGCRNLFLLLQKVTKSDLWSDAIQVMELTTISGNLPHPETFSHLLFL